MSGVFSTSFRRVRFGRSLQNVFWNTLGGAWGALMVVLVTPIYVARLGLGGYGILSLWVVAQMMMGLLDMGTGAGLTRALAQAQPGSSPQSRHVDLIRTLESIYWIAALVVAGALVCASPLVTKYWLHSETVDRDVLRGAVALMAISIGVQFPGGLYISGLAGMQQHGRMNALQILGTTLRYGAGVAVLAWRADLRLFFAAQIGVSVIQVLAARAVLWRVLQDSGQRDPKFTFESVRGLWSFSIGMAVSSVTAVVLANSDRMVLSQMASIEAVGKYSIAFTATGLLQLAIQPFYRSYFPRYAELISMGDETRLRLEYFESCRLLAVAIIPIAAVAWVFAPTIFHIWLGAADSILVSIFRCLLVGICCSGLMWLPAAFQQAHGWARLHTYMMGGAVAVGVPVAIWAIGRYGPVGATAIWLLHGGTEITIGLWFMHRRLLKGDLARWYRVVLAKPTVVAVASAALCAWAMPHSEGRLPNVIWVGGSTVATVAVTFACSVLWRREHAFKN